MRTDDLPTVPVGFDYAQAVLRIHTKRTYQQIAEYIGYADRSGVFRLTKGQVPPHPQGEALWALYLHLFGEKPPHTIAQRTGHFVAQPQQGAMVSTL